MLVHGYTSAALRRAGIPGASGAEMPHRPCLALLLTHTREMHAPILESVYDSANEQERDAWHV